MSHTDRDHADNKAGYTDGAYELYARLVLFSIAEYHAYDCVCQLWGTEDGETQ